MKKPVVVTSGEPAGIGPDICLTLAFHDYPVVVIGDRSVLEARANMLGMPVVFEEYQPGVIPSKKHGHLTILSLPCDTPVVPGILNPENVSYVVNMLTLATDRCLSGEFAAMVTAPVNKSVINQAGFAFTGHTEFLASRCKVETVVMLLACKAMKVALITTHLPLREVPDSVTERLICKVINILNTGLQQDFAISTPTIYVAGLNPHAGEGGFLGREEIEVIAPALLSLRVAGIQAHGPFPADTMFTTSNAKTCDAFVAMYHDQGLAVLKYADFEQAVNITLGLPIIRTSVDHGTALELAGTGRASSGSLLAAVETALEMVRNRNDNH
jgi:4-hydroxythreonine-4-phosphate dehydrogenase